MMQIKHPTTKVKELADERPTVYLSGPMEALDDYGIGWREDVKERYNEVNWILPHDMNDPREVDVVLHDSPLKSPGKVSSAKIVDDDKNAIDRSDGMLVGIPKDVRREGTMAEVIHAHSSDIPVAVWRPPEVGLSPWMYDHVHYTTSDLYEAVDWLTEYLS